MHGAFRFFLQHNFICICRKTFKGTHSIKIAFLSYFLKEKQQKLNIRLEFDAHQSPPPIKRF